MLTRPRLAWAIAGHPGEYCLNIPGYGADPSTYIPRHLSQEIADALPGFHVDNRGSRIEIINRAGYGIPDHDTVRAGVTAVLGDVDLEDRTAPAPAAGAV